MPAQDPALPGTFGVSVNSNMHVATISVFGGLFGENNTTETTFFVHVDPPSTA